MILLRSGAVKVKRTDNFHLFSIMTTNIFAAGLVLTVSILFFVMGHDSNDYRYALLGVMLFWCYGMFYGMINLSKLYGYTIMNFMLFVFFLSRPTLAMFYDTGWTIWNDGIVEKALLLVFVSETALFAGSYFIKQTDRAKSLQINESVNYNEVIQRALLVIVLITAALSAYSTMKNYLHYSSLAYEELYVAHSSSDNIFVRASITLCPYAVFAYLATMPSKKNSLLTLAIYIALGLPTFLLGNRASLVLRIAFAVAYFFIRDYTDSLYSERWIKRSLKIGFISFVVLSIAFLGAFNYYRSGLNPNSETSIPIMLDFFYRQGTTFDTVCQGLQYQSDIMSLPQSSAYSIGPIYDTVKHSTLSKMFFNTTGLGSGNSVTMVMKGNSLAHKLSYVVLGEASYLSGFGRGSSYLIELFYDGGIPLVIVFSFIVGAYLASINYLIQKGSWFVNTIVIATLDKIFYIPRASTFDFLFFLFTPHFWLIMILAMLVLFYSESKDAFYITPDKRLCQQSKQQQNRNR